MNTLNAMASPETASLYASTPSPQPQHPGMGELFAALAKAQADFPDIPKTKTGYITKTETFNYADISDVLAAVRPVLAKHGLCFWQTAATAPLLANGEMPMGSVTVRSFIGHSSGAVLASEGFTVWARDMHPQSLGMADTYARRYDGVRLMALSCVMDTDGVAPGGDHIQQQGAKPANGKSSAQKLATGPQVRKLQVLLDKTGADLAKMLDYYKVEKMEDLSMNAASEAIDKLSQREAEQQGANDPNDDIPE